jgi:hypothetical protein
MAREGIALLHYHQNIRLHNLPTLSSSMSPEEILSYNYQSALLIHYFYFFVVHFGLLALAQKYSNVASHEKLIGLSRADVML